MYLNTNQQLKVKFRDTSTEFLMRMNSPCEKTVLFAVGVIIWRWGRKTVIHQEIKADKRQKNVFYFTIKRLGNIGCPWQIKFLLSSQIDSFYFNVDFGAQV